MNDMSLIDEARAKLLYCSETGVFTWRTRDRNLSGLKAGGVCPTSGYSRIRLGGRLISAHRIAVALAYGSWPDGEVDHINGNRTDNRLVNLRVVTRAINQRNKSKYKNNCTGVVGVHWHKQHRKWCAKIQKNKKNITLGVFHDFDQAVEIRRAAERKMQFHENHGRAGNV